MIPVPHVLVVDDDRLMRGLLSHVLIDEHIRVETFASAAELLSLHEFTHPAVLVLDQKMPEMSGLELQALLRLRGVDVPIIFMSGQPDLKMAVSAMRNGAIDFLEKPFAMGELILRIRAALDLQVALPSRMPPGRPGDAAERDFFRRVSTLTPRERSVHELMVRGQSSKLIARELGGSFRTIEIHRARVMMKMGAASIVELVRMNLRHGGVPSADPVTT